MQAKDPAKDLPVAILGGLGICTVLYLAMAAAICLMQPWQSIDLDAPFAVAFLAASPPSGFKRLFYATSARFVSLGAIAGEPAPLLRYCTGYTSLVLPRPWGGTALGRAGNIQTQVQLQMTEPACTCPAGTCMGRHAQLASCRAHGSRQLCHDCCMRCNPRPGTALLPVSVLSMCGTRCVP